MKKLQTRTVDNELRYMVQRKNELLRLLRPKQWIKNGFVFAGLIFSSNMFHIPFLIKSILAFILFCGISSSVYIINDIVDVEKDKLHPKKRFRPIPSGLITKSQAMVFFLIILLLSMTLSFLLDIKFGMVALVYFVMNLFYSFKFKNIVILDVMIIAVGFVLRAVSGAVVLGVIISPWLLVCTVFLALFLGLSKRKNEIVVMHGQGKEHRKILDEYSIENINQMLPVVTSCTIISYTLYTFSGAKSDAMLVTVLFVLYGIFRYQYITSNGEDGGSPELTLLKDIPMIINIVLWCITSIVIIYFF